MSKIIKTRIQQKHASEQEWLTSSLIPLDGEIIIYDEDANYNYKRIKVGDGETVVPELNFIDDPIYEVIDNNILNIDYDTLLAFDTSEIVIGATSTTSVLGQSILGQMILA